MKIDTGKKEIEEIISSRYIEKIYPSKEDLKKLLETGKRLSIYTGIDPTGPQLHLGHSINFFLLKKFQNLGHRVIYLIGDFTAQIGDPTGKLSTRRPLTKEQVLENCQGYQKQTEKILDFRSKKNPVEIKFNSRWLEKLTLKEIIELMAKVTVGQMIKRDMFQRRVEEKKEIYLHEFLYPLLQGYDSVAMNVDVEVGGNDQTFNMMMGRDLVGFYQNREKIVVATKLLINPKTKKKLMSKSEGDFIALDECPNGMYGKIMALPDEAIFPMLNLCTELSDSEINEIKKINPRDAKARLAFEATRLHHSEAEAKEAEAEFERVFKERKAPSGMPIYKTKEKKYNILEMLIKIKLAHSKSEAKRLVEQGGVEIRFKSKKLKVKSWQEKIGLEDGMIIQAGKRRFVKIKLKK